MRTDADRIAKYTAKTDSDNVALIVAARLAAMKSGFAARMAEWVGMESAIQALLNGTGVATIQYPFYLCYGREIQGLKFRGIEGASLTLEAQRLKDKWETWGLTSATLISLANDVFGITVT